MSMLMFYDLCKDWSAKNRQKEIKIIEYIKTVQKRKAIG